jgi:tRNA dimethylallyltransferase
MQRIIVIGGPTATGKSELAIKLSKKFPIEIINGDSRQIYKYMDIGTNKDPLELSKLNNQEIYTTQTIPEHIVNIIEPSETFSVYDYQKLANFKIKEILRRGNLPVIVGGTGLYIDSIFNNYKLNKSEADPEFRAELEKRSTHELQELLKVKNAEILAEMNNSDRNNPRRLIRAIEKSAQSFKTPKPSSKKIYDFTFLYPEYEWESLKTKIIRRVEKMFDSNLEHNILTETKNLLELGFKSSDPGLQVMGYKESVSFLQGNLKLNECVETVQAAHINYAKRQRTWFESEKRGYNLLKVNTENILDLII